MGLDGVLADEAACGMPVSVQVSRLSMWLEARGIDAEVLQADLYALGDAERAVALDAIVAGVESPFVIVGDRLACSGNVDIGAVAEALGVA